MFILPKEMKTAMADAARTSKKLDNARGFAVNGQDKLSVGVRSKTARPSSDFSLPPNLLYYCTLSSPVGSPGTPTTAPELTYTITYNGTTYPGSFPVKAGGRPFPKGVITTPATWGYMRFDEDGNPELLEAKEVWRVDPCTPPTP